MKNINWEDLKLVYYVALAGSLTKAASNLNINYSTVIRHINRVETKLGCKLFIRHQRGYQLTDAGRVLLSEMPSIEGAFRRLHEKLLPDQETLEGTIKISTLSEYSSILHPLLQRSLELYPQLKIMVDVNDEVDYIESGLAHISIRAGKVPETGDLVFKQIYPLAFSYYASQEYIARKGLPENETQFNHHLWVMPSGRKRKISFVKPLLNFIDDKMISYQSNNFIDIQSAICHGLGIGPVDVSKAKTLPQLTRLNAIKEVADNSLWFVFHKDLRDDRKVRALWDLFKQFNVAVKTT
ncbi:LysR family transcriptional regulator [Aliikangiella maris]|uniref:LysR family transcriptional regulator n=2 Tax=Aliikangiella maris TaxID=3162458 RepID=A0ABV2BUV1_9GAMM